MPSLFHATERKEDAEAVSLLPSRSSHCAGARLLLGDYGLTRPVIIEIETLKR